MKNRSFTFLSPALYCLMSLLACTLVQANNLPPVAVIDLTPDKAVYYHGEIIALYGGNSYVQSTGNINYYQWYINGILKMAGPGATSYDHTVVMEPGLAEQPLTIRLRVQHSNGLWGEQTVTRTEKQKPGQHYYLTDHLGSVRATVNAAGTLIGWDDFYPFGMVMPGRSSNTANPNDLYKFTGHERDPEAGLDIDFMNARTYDNEIGRFLQRDPHEANYPGFSPFVYVGNNPLIFIDPDGRDWLTTQDERMANRIASRLGRIENRLARQEQRLERSIARAEARGNTDRAGRLTAQKKNVTAIRQDLATAQFEIAAMGADKNMVFTFNRVDPSTSSVGFVSADQEGNVVINFIAGDYGNTVHELKHAAQAQQGLITLSPGSDVVTFTGILPINAEIQGNQRQYSATQRVPVSDGGRPASFRGVKDSYVRGIYYIDSSGRKVYPYNSPIYQRQ